MTWLQVNERRTTYTKHKASDAHSQNSLAAMLTSSVDGRTHARAHSLVVNILLVDSASQRSKNGAFDFCLCV